MLWLGPQRQEALAWFSRFLTSEHTECSGLAGPVLTDLRTSALLWPAQHLHSFGLASLIYFLLMILSACPIILRWPISYSTLNIAYFWTKREHSNTPQYPDLDILAALSPCTSRGLSLYHGLDTCPQPSRTASFPCLFPTPQDFLDHFVRTTGPCTVWGAKVITILCYSILTKCRSSVA